MPNRSYDFLVQTLVGPRNAAPKMPAGFHENFLEQSLSLA